MLIYLYVRAAMIALDHSEAILFRMLTSFFGRDHVVPSMSVMTVCGGSLSNDLRLDGMGLSLSDLSLWAKQNKCLFTIVDHDDNPRMVVEFFSGFEDSVSNSDVEHQRYLRPVLAHHGVTYVTISNDEFGELLDPDGSLDLCSLLKSKFEPQAVSD